MKYPNLDNGYFLFILGWVSLLPVLFYGYGQIGSYYYLVTKLDVFAFIVFLFYDALAMVLFSIPFFLYSSFMKSYRPSGCMLGQQNCARILKKD